MVLFSYFGFVYSISRCSNTRSISFITSVSVKREVVDTSNNPWRKDWMICMKRDIKQREIYSRLIMVEWSNKLIIHNNYNYYYNVCGQACKKQSCLIFGQLLVFQLSAKRQYNLISRWSNKVPSRMECLICFSYRTTEKWNHLKKNWSPLFKCSVTNKL